MIDRHSFALIVATLLIAAAGAVATPAATAHGHGHGHDRSAPRFDYYLMSLSWSPSYCLTHGNETEQCGGHGFGFVLHGLWPQNRNGRWSQHCGTDTTPDAATVSRTLAFMPSRHLIKHEWQAHGACTGLDPRAYFELADKAFASVAIPAALKTPRAPPAMSAAEIQRAFVAANPGLGASMLRVVCHDGGELTEVRVCLDKETLAPQACGGRVRNSCRYGKLRIPAVR
jgi:ribonuclease T2